ncbi:MAG: DUF4260 domain-containing protein [Candidatus Limnocylindrales bacterium]
MERDPLVRWLLRTEGVAALAGGAALYRYGGGDWIWFLPLLIVPDVSAVGYLVNPLLGAITYNLVHTYVLAVAVVLVGWWIGAPQLIAAGGIVAAHIGMDRTLGYGLKYPTAFQDTHLGRIGRKRETATR